jgi:uncharacterized protein
MSGSIPLVPRSVTCPSCQGEALYASTNPWRPFCSARCKGVDFGAWASEHYSVAAAPTTTLGPAEDSSVN